MRAVEDNTRPAVEVKQAPKEENSGGMMGCTEQKGRDFMTTRRERPKRDNEGFRGVDLYTLSPAKS